MYEARVIGVDRVVGPMVESPWALHKYLAAVKHGVSGGGTQSDVQFCVNIETVTGVENFDAMLELPDVAELDGIVLGRVDMCGSMGLTREDINSAGGLRDRDAAVHAGQSAGPRVRHRWRGVGGLPRLHAPTA